MNLPELPQDKANHFVYGALIAAVVSCVSSPWWALVVVSAFAILKELSDAWQNYKSSSDPLIGPHGVEFWDAAATMLGGAVVIAPQLIKG